MSTQGAKQQSKLKSKATILRAKQKSKLKSKSSRVILRAKPEGSRLKWLSIYWLPTFVWAGVIFYLSHLPVEELPSWEIPYLDKVIHLIEFGLLATLCLRSFVATYPSRSNQSLILITFVVVFCYAILDEYHQSFVIGRITDVYDLAADTSGILLALLLSKRD